MTRRSVRRAVVLAAVLALPGLLAARWAKQQWETWQRVRDLVVDCALVGDSIAEGVGRLLPGCTTRAAPGAPSATYAANYPGAVSAAHFVAVSLGTNDHFTGMSLEATRAALETVRRRVSAPRVIWLSPIAAGPAVEQVVAAVAAAHGDEVMDIGAETRLGRDGIHPSAIGNQRIAQRLAP